MAPQAAARELRRATDGDPNTYPEGDPVDLLGFTSGGQTAYVESELRPGTYVAMCLGAERDGSAPRIHGSTAIVD